MAYLGLKSKTNYINHEYAINLYFYLYVVVHQYLVKVILNTLFNIFFSLIKNFHIIFLK
jgi:hypothetical protein